MTFALPAPLIAAVALGPSVHRLRGILLALLLIVCATPGWSEGRRVVEKSDFVALVGGQSLTRMGIRLSVGADGAIRGSAFGRPVSGAWRWQGGYFCRDLFWGDRDLGANCQEVRLRGDVMRFTSDRGTGRFADLTLR